MIKLSEILNLKDSLYINNSNIHGKGLFTKEFIPKNTEIFLVANCNNYKTDTDNVITYLGKYINHIDNANCIVKIKGRFGYLYSIIDIQPNQELTCNYKNLPFIFDKDVEGFKLK